jgi:type VI secretion system protein ImpG
MFESSETLNTLFLRELEALDAFALERETEGALTLGTADPDVRRLLEALAFFSARTKASAADCMTEAVRRIAGSVLDELLEPVPAAMLVECETERLLEPVVLPRGTLLRVVDGQRTGLFSTLFRTVLRPIRIERVRLDERGGRRVLQISVRSSVRERTAFRLALHVRRLSDYRASLSLYDALERHLVRAFVMPRGTEQRNDEPVRCGVRFDTRLTDAVDDLEDRGPLIRLRSLFHFPEQELYLCFDVPAFGTAWEQLDLCLELDSEFPSDVAFTVDHFRLNVVPVVNSWVDAAEPIVYRGLTDAVAVRYPGTAFTQVEPAGVRAVYRTAPNGLFPLLPAVLASNTDCYEVEDNGRRLRLRVDDAFEHPCRIIPEISWQQPQLWASGATRPVISVYSRHLPTVSFRAIGLMRAAKRSALSSDLTRCLDVLSYRMQQRLTRNMLSRVLEILGVSDEGPYRGMAALVLDLESREEPYTEAGAVGLRIAYELALSERTPDERALTRRFAKHIAELLSAWTALPVEVSSKVIANSERPARPTRGSV